MPNRFARASISGTKYAFSSDSEIPQIEEYFAIKLMSLSWFRPLKIFMWLIFVIPVMNKKRMYWSSSFSGL